MGWLKLVRAPAGGQGGMRRAGLHHARGLPTSTAADAHGARARARPCVWGAVLRLVWSIGLSLGCSLRCAAAASVLLNCASSLHRLCCLALPLTRALSLKELNRTFFAFKTFPQATTYGRNTEGQTRQLWPVVRVRHTALPLLGSLLGAPTHAGQRRLEHPPAPLPSSHSHSHRAPATPSPRPFPPSGFSAKGGRRRRRCRAACCPPHHQPHPRPPRQPAPRRRPRPPPRPPPQL